MSESNGSEVFCKDCRNLTRNGLIKSWLTGKKVVCSRVGKLEYALDPIEGKIVVPSVMTGSSDPREMNKSFNCGSYTSLVG